MEGGSENPHTRKTIVNEGKRRRHDEEFRARVTLEALKGHNQHSKIAVEYEIQATQVTERGETVLEGIGGVFRREKRDEGKGFEAEREKIQSKTGELEIGSPDRAIQYVAAPSGPGKRNSLARLRNPSQARVHETLAEKAA